MAVRGAIGTGWLGTTAALLVAAGALLLATPAGAELDLGVNHDLSAKPGPQAGAALALVPGDPDRGAAASSDPPRPPVAHVSDEGFRPSRVVARPFPARAVADAGVTPISPCCEPALAAHEDGTIWVAAATLDGAIAVARIAAGGTSIAAEATLLPREPGARAERPSLAAGPGGRLAAAWVETQGGDQRVAVAVCEPGGDPAGCDQPAAWQGPAALGGAGRGGSPDLDYAPDGTLHAVWHDSGAANAIELASCELAEDCGLAGGWGAPATVRELDSYDDDGDGSADSLPAGCPIIAAPGGKVGPTPSVETGPDGTVAVAFSDLRDNADPGRPSRCTGSASDKTIDSYLAVGSAPGEAPAPADSTRISRDGEYDLNDHFLPSLSVDPADGRIELAYWSTVDDPSGQRAVRLYTSSADGTGFTPPRPISTAASRFAGHDSTGADYGERQGADSSAGTFRAAWTDNRPLQARDTDLYVLAREAETAILAGPTGTVPGAVATFHFTSSATRAQCRLDYGRWRGCSSPLRTQPLPNGPHSFEMRGVDGVDNPANLTPERRGWTINDTTPPETVLTVSPRPVSKEARPRFEFAADEAGATFECRYDQAPFSRCPRGLKSQKVGVGRHTFRVRAIDVGGNVDPSPIAFRFSRLAACGAKADAKKRKRCKRRNAKLRLWPRSARG